MASPSSHSISTFEMGYLETLSISDLFTYLKSRNRSGNFKKVEKILISREEKMVKNAENSAKDLEMCKNKLSDLLMALEEEKKTNDREVDKLGKLKSDKIATEIQLHKYKTVTDELIEKNARLEEDSDMQRARSSKLMVALEAKKKETLALEYKLGKLEDGKIDTEIQLHKHKAMSDELLEKVARLEEDLEMQRAKNSESVITLEKKEKESLALEDKLGILESGKIATENELKGYKMTCKKLKEKVVHVEEESKSVGERITILTKDLEIYKDKWSDLLLALEEKKKENIILEDKLCKLEILKNNAESQVKQHMTICDELKRKAACKEEEFQVVYEQERMATERVNFFAKNWEMHKEKRKELSNSLEEKEKECTTLKDKLEKLENDKIVTQNELKGYKVICDELRQKISFVEDKSKIVLERERTMTERIQVLLDELDKSNAAQKLMKLNEENKDLKYAKRKAEDELEEQKESYKMLENDKNATQDELKWYKVICDKLKGKIALVEEHSMIVLERERTATEKIKVLSGELEKTIKDTSQKFIELNEEIKDLKFVKREAEDELEEQKEMYKVLKNDMIVTQNELKGYKVTCVKLKGKISLVEENSKTLIEREGTATERIKLLSDELGKTNKDTTQKLIKLVDENEDLKCAKRKTEDELEVRNRRYKVLKTQLKKYMEEETLHTISGQTNLEVGGKILYDEGKKVYGMGVDSICFSSVKGSDCKLALELKWSKSGKKLCKQLHSVEKMTKRQSQRNIHPPDRLNL